MQETTRSRHHLLRLTSVERVKNLGSVVAKQIFQRRSQSLRLFDGKHAFSCVVQTNNPALLIDDNYGILHVLENCFVGEWREFDDLLTNDQPRIDWQHGRKREWHIRNRVGAYTEIVGRRRK